MTTRADTFVDTAGTGLLAHTATGPNGGWAWTNAEGTGSTAAINASNQLKMLATVSGTFTAATVGSNDQFAQVGVMAASDSFHVIVGSARGSSGSFYGARYKAGNWELFKCVSGSFTQLGSSAAALTAGDVAKLQAVGTAVTLFVNGVSTLTATDSSVTSGETGFQMRSDPATDRGFPGIAEPAHQSSHAS